MLNRIDLYLGSDIGKLMDIKLNWEFGKVYRSWDENFRDDKEEYFSNNLPKIYAGVSIHWPKLFSESFINKYKFLLNVHPGFLPEGRGMYPVFWAVFNQTKAGVTTHQITKKLDFGPILFRDEVEFGEFETGEEVWNKVRELEKNHIIKLLELLKKFPDNLPLWKIQEDPGIVRTKRDFEILRDSGHKDAYTNSELTRLRLAFANSKYDFPKWLN